MKRVLALTLCAALALALLAGCSNSAAKETVPPTDPAVTDGPLGEPDPTQEPSASPSAEPSEEPSEEPSQAPSEEPSMDPVENPSLKPLPTTPEPTPTPKPTPAPTPTPAPPVPEATPAPADGVDLSAFYTDITGQYQFAFMMEADDVTLDQMFAGLSGLDLAQRLVYICGMMPSPNGDFVLIQVSDSKDAAAVESILQARIDYMVGDGNGPGGAFYPMEATMWEENARIVTNGSYVMLIVHENCDDIVAAFNALF